MPELHPGCLVATITYQEQMFDAEVRRMNVESVLSLRKRFADWLGEIVDSQPDAALVDVNALADHLTVIVEGAIILSKALADRQLMGRHMRLFREQVKQAFA